MSDPLPPIEAMSDALPPIEAVATGTAGFAGAGGPDPPEVFTSAAELDDRLGETAAELGRMVQGFFDNGGTRAYVAGTLAALEAVDEVALLCPLPEDSSEAIAQCDRRRDRVAILSLPGGLTTVEEVLAARPREISASAALHHPWVRAGGRLTPPGGHVAGLHAAGDAALRPAAVDLRGLDDPPLERALSSPEIAALVDGAVNSLRDLTRAGRGVRLWSARTLDPSRDPELRWLAPRRQMLFLETSISRWLQGVVFEADAALWARVQDAVHTFLFELWRAGALSGRTPDEAFFARCDRTTMTQEDLDQGRLVCLIGVALLRPAEFAILRVGQWRPDP